MLLGFGYLYVSYALFLFSSKNRNNRLKISQLAKILLYYFFVFASSSVGKARKPTNFH